VQNKLIFNNVTYKIIYKRSQFQEDASSSGHGQLYNVMYLKNL